MPEKSRTWVAFVVGINNDINKTVASFISFEARNKFVALQQIQKNLPDNPNWILKSGEIIPFRILAMHQCKPEEVEMYMQGYVDQFAEMVGREPDFEGFSSKPSSMDDE